MNQLQATFLAFFGFIGSVQALSADYPIEPVPFNVVSLSDSFWAPKIETNHSVTIPIALKQCYQTGRVDNFLKAGGLKQGSFVGDFPFDDTDIYKILEGASYSIRSRPDKDLDAHMDALIYYIGRAQEPDGYLYATRTIDPANPHQWAGAKRWERTWDLSHELYNLGHLYEAAVAHYQATGKKTLLDIALRSADLLCRDFGYGKLEIVPGHQIVEMGLVKLYRVTGQEKYLDLAKFFLDIRGHNKVQTRGEYCQDHLPVTEQDKAVGHAVRAMYMYSAMADVAALEGDVPYVEALDKIWDDILHKKFYLTGGIGAAAGHEGFGPDYELPNLSAYNETCASIGEIYWNYRMFLLKGDSRYFDVLEQVLYNGLISGVSIKGSEFFYPNPLASMGNYTRSEWFGCACCPSNICRFLPSIPGYVYAKKDDCIYVNLFVHSTAKVNLSEVEVSLRQVSGYPWQGDVTIEVEPSRESLFELAVRIPAWTGNRPVPSALYSFLANVPKSVVILVNGEKPQYKMEKGYAVISRVWKKGDIVSVTLPMDPRKVICSDYVKANLGKMAIQRGPIVYCVEGVDNSGKNVRGIMIDKNEKLKTFYDATLLGGIQIIEGKNFRAIPYFAWDNRGVSAMNVWMPYNKTGLQNTENKRKTNEFEQ